MFKHKKIKRIDRKKLEKLRAGEPFWVVDEDGIVLAEGKIPRKRKDGTRTVKVYPHQKGFLRDIAVQRNGKWTFVNWPSSRETYLVPGNILEIIFYE